MQAFSTTSVSAGWMCRMLVATSSTVLPRYIAWTSGWISIDAWGPMKCGPIRQGRVSGSPSTFRKLLVSSSAQP